jgi:RNA polymerase sigma factor (sigma-70 family)
MGISFDEIYNENFKRIYAYFNVKFGRHCAEDLSQRLFTRLWEYLCKHPNFRADDWGAWLFRLAVNLKNDYLREKYRTHGNQSTEDLPEKPFYHAHDENNAVNNALRSLDCEDMDLLLLKANGFNSREIGEMLGKPETTVRSRLGVARKRFAAALAKEGVTI